MPLTRPTRLALAVAVASLATAAHAENLTPNLQLNGFASAGVSWVDEDFGGRVNGNVFNDKGITEHPNFQMDNVFGLQVTYTMDDKFDLVGQLVSEGRNDYQTEAEWAYLAWRLDDNWRLRAGRLTAPFYMYSESLNVGHAYPWVRLPVELYLALYVKTMDGMDLQFRNSLGDSWAIDTQLYGGESYGAFGKVRDAYGLNVNLTTDALTLHAGYGQGKIDFNVAANVGGSSIEQAEYLLEQFGSTFNTRNQDVSFADLGAQFDNGEWFAAAEYGQLRMNGWGTDWDAGFASVGHYFGKWLPFAAAAQANPRDTGECTAYMSQAYTNGVAQASLYASQSTFYTNQAGTLNGQAAAATAQAGTYAALYISGGGNPANLSSDPTYIGYLTTAATASTQADAAMAQAVLYAQGAGQVNAALPMAQSVSDTICPGKEQTTYSVGFRYDATKNVSIKAQVDHVQDFNGTPGFTNDTLRQPDKLNMFSFNINAAF